MSARSEEIAANLAAVRRRIESAADAAGRDPDELTLIVVTKYFPASDVRILADLGVGDVGENRHQEAQAKSAELADLDLRWHYIGGLQSNKAAAVASYADAVHSVDRAKLLGGLSRGAAGRVLDCLVQVDLGGGADPGRAGALPEDVDALADEIARADHLRLRGLMTVAPLGAPPQPAFERLHRLGERLRERHPDATWLSAGMSGDLEEAVAAGATHLRVGSAVLGSRPPVQ